MVLGIHWGSWNMSSVDKGVPLFLLYVRLYSEFWEHEHGIGKSRSASYLFSSYIMVVITVIIIVMWSWKQA